MQPPAMLKYQNAVARAVINFDHLHSAAVAVEQRRQKAMHVVELRQIQKGLPREELEPAAGIRRSVFKQHPAYVVGNS